MLGIFEDTDTELYPAQDPNVIASQAALDAASEVHAPAQHAWADYCAAHCDEVVRVPFPRDKQRLIDQLQDTAEAVAEAEAAYTVALAAATEKATAAWDAIIRQRFVDDLPTITAFIQLLEKHEQTVTEAQAAGVSRMLKVPIVFITAGEVAGRLAYAKKALNVK